MRSFNTLILYGMIAVILTTLACQPLPESSQEKTGTAMTIIPQPRMINVMKGHFIFSDQTMIWASDPLVDLTFLGEYLSALTGASFASAENEAGVILELQELTDLPPEGYHLTVLPEKIVIRAGDTAGLFYGIQTLRQMLPVDVETHHINNLSLPCVIITDYPRFGWRGMHLDVSRHFFPVEFIKRYIDMIALHKMNVFHWHLTDDNGWRIEIKRYPELTDICAWHVDREHENWREWSPVKEGEATPIGGFYTQDEIREVVSYATQRQITVIPEIEMPGHTSEVFAAFPELSCRGERLPVVPGSYWPNKDIFCAGNEEVFQFLENVLDEVIDLFPSDYIHIGGDEANKTYWETCTRCQQRIKDENLSGEDELQSWFIKRIENFLLSRGKRLIGWDEILEGGLAPEATVMSWRGVEGGIKAARQGHDVIMTPTSHVYFDYYQGDPATEPEAIGGYTTLKKVYSYEPVPKKLTAAEAKHILGAQANLWTEFVRTTDHAEYMVLPRMSALSEVLWSDAGQRNWQDFKSRLQVLEKRFDALGWNYRQG